MHAASARRSPRTRWTRPRSCAGDPQVARRSSARRTRYAWSASGSTVPASSTDVEADEVFVVLAGRATVEVDGGPTLELGPGDVGILDAGDRTTWTVHETLRKVFLLPPADCSPAAPAAPDRRRVRLGGLGPVAPRAGSCV